MIRRVLALCAVLLVAVFTAWPSTQTYQGHGTGGGGGGGGAALDAANTWTALQTFSAGATMAGVSTTSVNGIATTSTDGLVVQNGTAATAGAPVQLSPRVRVSGAAWNTTSTASQTVDYFTEVLPASAATPSGVWRLGYSLNGAAAIYPLTVSSSGNLATTASVTAGNSVGFGGNFQVSGKTLIMGVTLPSATGTFGTGSSVVTPNGSAAFVVNVGTGGTASTGTITFGAAANGWIVSCQDVTNAASFVTAQTGGTTTTATLQNFSRTTGAAIAWTASDLLRCTALAY